VSSNTTQILATEAARKLGFNFFNLKTYFQPIFKSKQLENKKSLKKPKSLRHQNSNHAQICFFKEKKNLI
jgi:hypothetical protein